MAISHWIELFPCEGRMFNSNLLQLTARNDEDPLAHLTIVTADDTHFTTMQQRPMRLHSHLFGR
jgi:hypothetical protein